MMRSCEKKSIRKSIIAILLMGVLIIGALLSGCGSKLIIGTLLSGCSSKKADTKKATTDYSALLCGKWESDHDNSNTDNRGFDGVIACDPEFYDDGTMSYDETTWNVVNGNILKIETQEGLHTETYSYDIEKKDNYHIILYRHDNNSYYIALTKQSGNTSAQMSDEDSNENNVSGFFASKKPNEEDVKNDLAEELSLFKSFLTLEDIEIEDETTGDSSYNAEATITANSSYAKDKLNAVFSYSLSGSEWQLTNCSFEWIGLDTITNKPSDEEIKAALTEKVELGEDGSINKIGDVVQNYIQVEYTAVWHFKFFDNSRSFIKRYVYDYESDSWNFSNSDSSEIKSKVTYHSNEGKEIVGEYLACQEGQPLDNADRFKSYRLIINSCEQNEYGYYTIDVTLDDGKGNRHDDLFTGDLNGEMVIRFNGADGMVHYISFSFDDYIVCDWIHFYYN